MSKTMDFVSTESWCVYVKHVKIYWAEVLSISPLSEQKNLLHSDEGFNTWNFSSINLHGVQHTHINFHDTIHCNIQNVSFTLLLVVFNILFDKIQCLTLPTNADQQTRPHQIRDLL